jgi:hypothetical protein
MALAGYGWGRFYLFRQSNYKKIRMRNAMCHLRQIGRSQY